MGYRLLIGFAAAVVLGGLLERVVNGNARAEALALIVLVPLASVVAASWIRTGDLSVAGHVTDLLWVTATTAVAVLAGPPVWRRLSPATRP